MMRNRKHFLATCAVALATGFAGVGVGTAVSFAEDSKAGGHTYEKAMEHHVHMAQDAEGAAKMKEMMLMMSAHQYLLGEMADKAEVKKLAETPAMKIAIAEVKATLKDHAKLDAKKAEVAKDDKEAMMTLAHALLKQDAEAAKMLKAAEEGKH